MEKRILRPRKEPEKENREPQPAKRTGRAISTIERCKEPEKKNREHQPAKRTRRAISTIERSTFRVNSNVQPIKRKSSSSTQTDCCLTATNAQLTQELIAMKNIIQQKDQRYIDILEQSYLQKERFESRIRDQQSEIAELTQQIQLIRNAPLVELENNGEMMQLDT